MKITFLGFIGAAFATVIVLFIAACLLAFGADLAEADAARQCEVAGQFQVKDRVYECRPMRNANYFGLETFR